MYHIAIIIRKRYENIELRVIYLITKEGKTMIKLLKWMQKHKLLTLLITLLIFFLPLALIYILYRIGMHYALIHAEWSAGDLLVYTASFEAVLGTVSLGALSLWQNIQIEEDHNNSLDPMLSMKLEHNHLGFLCLTIENTGRSAAEEVKIKIEKITDNADYKIMPGPLFEQPFELYPNEMVQDVISSGGGTVYVFPKVFIDVSYKRKDSSKQFHYKRTVIFNGGYSKKVTADVKMDMNKVISSLDSIARSSVRTANYLDGHRLHAFDEINVLSSRSLQNDLADTFDKEKKKNLSGEETIKEKLKNGQQDSSV